MSFCAVPLQWLTARLAQPGASLHSPRQQRCSAKHVPPPQLLGCKQTKDLLRGGYDIRMPYVHSVTGVQALRALRVRLKHGKCWSSLILCQFCIAYLVQLLRDKILVPLGYGGLILYKKDHGHWGQPYSRGYEQPFGVTFILSWCAILFSLAFLDYQGTTPGVPSPRPRGDVTRLTKSALWWPRSLKSSRIITDYLCVTYANSQKIPCHVSPRGAVCFSAGTTWSPGRFLLTSHHLQSP